jgi:phosphatidylinositol-3-phosphatase
VPARLALIVTIAVVAGLAGCQAGPASPSTASPPPASPPLSAAALPRPAHIVVVVEENHSYSDIIGNADAPYINALASRGALMTSSFAVAHPSEPNYMALFAGGTFGLGSDACPVNEGAAANLGSELIAAGDSFTGYAEGLPSPGSAVCSAGEYARKHAPWANFSNIPASSQLPFSDFPADYSRLPTVSFVIPDLLHDMHDGTVAEGDTWLKDHLSGYATWARTHDSLLIITWDEDDYSQNNQIPTIIAGQPVTQGRYGQRINHYNVLATIEAMYGLPARTGAGPVGGVWSS